MSARRRSQAVIVATNPHRDPEIVPSAKIGRRAYPPQAAIRVEAGPTSCIRIGPHTARPHRCPHLDNLPDRDWVDCNPLAGTRPATTRSTLPGRRRVGRESLAAVFSTPGRGPAAPGAERPTNSRSRMGADRQDPIHPVTVSCPHERSPAPAFRRASTHPARHSGRSPACGEGLSGSGPIAPRAHPGH